MFWNLVSGGYTSPPNRHAIFYCREWIILSLVLCEARKPCKIIVWQLSGGNWELKKHRAIIVWRLLESTSWSIYQQLDLPDRYCPDIVQILSGYCPDIVWMLSGCCLDIVQMLSGCCPAGQISRNFSVVKTGLIFNVWQFWDHPWGQFFTLYRFFMVLGPSLLPKSRFFNKKKEM